MIDSSRTTRDPDRHSRDRIAPREPTRWARSRCPPTAMGGADAAQPGAFLDQRRPNAEASLSRLRLRQEGGGIDQCRGRPAAAVEGGRDRVRRRRGDQGPARRAFSALYLAEYLADRFGHPVEHECQRGVVEPRDPTARWQNRQQRAGASERRRQYGPVIQRYLPDRG